MNKIGILFFAVLLAAVCVGAEDSMVRYGVVHDGVVHIDFSDPIFSRLDEEGKNVLREYAKVYPKIKKFYGNIRIDVTEKIFSNTAGEDSFAYVPLNSPPILKKEELFEVRYNTPGGDTRGTGFSRVDAQVVFLFDDPRRKRQKNQLDYGRRVNLMTPETAFSLQKKNSKDQFYSLSAKRNRGTHGGTVGVVVRGFDTAPFSVEPFFMEEFFFRKSLSWDKGTPFFVVSAKYIGQMVELVAQMDYPETPSLPLTWKVILARDSWVVKEVFEQAWTAGGDRFWTRKQCVYDGECEGMPLLSSYQIDFGIYDTDETQTERMTSRTRYDVTKIVPGPVDLSEFDVAQFLPPNVKIGEVMEPARLSAARIAAIVIGIILIIWGVYMKIRNRNT